MGLWGLLHIREAFDRFKAALAERDIEIDAHPGIEALYGEIDYPMESLRAFLEAKKARAEPAKGGSGGSTLLDVGYYR
jgi:hypothetical protein